MKKPLAAAAVMVLALASGPARADFVLTPVAQGDYVVRPLQPTGPNAVFNVETGGLATVGVGVAIAAPNTYHAFEVFDLSGVGERVTGAQLAGSLADFRRSGLPGAGDYLDARSLIVAIAVVSDSAAAVTGGLPQTAAALDIWTHLGAGGAGLLVGGNGIGTAPAPFCQSDLPTDCVEACRTGGQRLVLGFASDSSTMTKADLAGFQLVLHTVSVPEPSCVILVTIGLGGTGIWVKRRVA